MGIAWKDHVSEITNDVIVSTGTLNPTHVTRSHCRAAYVVMGCLSVCLSRSCILSKRINRSSKFFHHPVAKLDVSAATGHVLSTRRRRTSVPQVVTLIAGSKWRSLLIAEDDDEMFMTRSLNVTPKTTEQHCTQ